MKLLGDLFKTEGKGLKRRPFPRPPSQLASRQPSLRYGSPTTNSLVIPISLGHNRKASVASLRPH